jgi:hypothetical protein
MSEAIFGDYSYAVNDSSIVYAEIGRFCSIASNTRISPGNHPMWRAALHHFTYRSLSYGFELENDTEFFEWRHSHQVVLGNDVCIGHGATILAGVTIGTAQQLERVLSSRRAGEEGEKALLILDRVFEKMQREREKFIERSDSFQQVGSIPNKPVTSRAPKKLSASSSIGKASKVKLKTRPVAKEPRN